MGHERWRGIKCSTPVDEVVGVMPYVGRQSRYELVVATVLSDSISMYMS